MFDKSYKQKLLEMANEILPKAGERLLSGNQQDQKCGVSLAQLLGFIQSLETIQEDEK